MIRPFEQRDDAAIGALLDVAFPEPRERSMKDGTHGPPLEQPLRRTFVAEDGGRVVGAATFVCGSRHPRRAWFDLVVAPGQRRRGIGSALLREIRGASPRPLWTRCRLADEAGFLHAHGFALATRFWDGRLDVAAAVAALGAPAVDEPEPDEAAKFFERWYQETHRWDPPAPWPLERAREVFVDGALPRSLVCVRRDGAMLGAACVNAPPPFDPPDELHLSWIGTLPLDDPAGADLVAACARFALDAGKRLRFEADASNTGVCEILLRLATECDAVGMFAES